MDIPDRICFDGDVTCGVNRSFDNHLRRTIDQIAHIRHIGHIFRSGDQIHLRCLDRYPRTDRNRLSIDNQIDSR